MGPVRAFGPTLEANGIVHRFGPLVALSNVSLRIAAGERHGVIGPNGSGKSTLLKILAGSLRATKGEIRLAGQEITRWGIYRRANHGVTMKFQVPRVFSDLTVAENIAIAAHFATDGGFHQLRVPSLDLTLNFSEDMNASARSLSHGHRQWLELIMTLETKPHFLLLDEPTAGMSPIERKLTAQLIAELPCAVVLVDHDIPLVAQLCDRITLLHEGVVRASGSTQQVLKDPMLREVYTAVG
jgi:branched-chain amino acid transport system ATP-binding protein